MIIAESKVTSQGQISIPADVRKRLGIGPGSVIEWDQEGEKITVRRARKYTLEEVRRALFPKGPPKRASLKDMKRAIARHAAERYARS